MAYIFAPTITGSGTVNVLAGTTIFTADNTYAGNTTIASGAALSLGNGGTTGNVVGPIFNSGVLAFDHSNTFIVPGVIAGTGAVQQNGTGTTILTADNLYTGGTTINDGSLQLGNGGLSGSIVGDVTNNATLIFNRSNTYNFDGTISGAGSVGQIGTGTTTFNTPQDYTGTTNINAGVLEVNSTLASPAVNVNAGGTLAGIGDLAGHVVNAGTVAPGTSLVGFGTLTVGSYAGLGGTLTIDTQLGDDNSPTDQLIIDGGTATGTTGVIVTNQGGPGAQTTGNGIPIILPTGGATIAAGTFGASGSVVPGAAAGVYQYLLYQGTEAGGGSAEAEQTYYLRSHEGDTPLYRPDVSIHSILANMARRQELATLGTFHERNGDQRLAGGAGNRTAAWGRLFGEMTEQSHSGTVSAHFDGSMGGLQAGVDAMQWLSPSGHQDRFGLFAAYARTTGDVRGHALGDPNRIAGRAELDGTSFGGYWTHLAPTGWYTDTVVMGTRFDGGGHSVVGTDLDVDGYGVTASVEGGYPIALGGGIRLEPQAQLVYSHISLDDVHDPHSHVAYHTPDALFGRLGVRLSADMLPLPMMLRPYLKANVWQDFTEADTIRFSGVHEITSRHRATSLELGGGVVAQLSRDVGLWINADYTTDIGGPEERESVRGTAGLRVTW